MNTRKLITVSAFLIVILLILSVNLHADGRRMRATKTYTVYNNPLSMSIEEGQMVVGREAIGKTRRGMIQFLKDQTIADQAIITKIELFIFPEPIFEHYYSSDHNTQIKSINEEDLSTPRDFWKHMDDSYVYANTGMLSQHPHDHNGFYDYTIDLGPQAIIDYENSDPYNFFIGLVEEGDDHSFGMICGWEDNPCWYIDNGVGIDGRPELIITYENPRLNPGQSYLSLPYESGTRSLSIDTNLDSWECESSVPWLGVEKGDNSIIISHNENSEWNERSGTIWIRSGSIEKSIDVTQAGKEPSIELDPKSQSVNSTQGNYTLNVISNSSDWTLVGSDQSWAHPIKISNTEIRVNVDANTSRNLRTAKIKTSLGSIEAVADITQSGNSCYILPTVSSRTVPGNSGITTVSITSNTNWSSYVNADWITVEDFSGYIDLLYEPNQNSSSREALVTLTGEECESTIRIIQESGGCAIGYSPHSRTVSSSSGNTSFSVAHFQEWRAYSSEPWVQVSYDANMVFVSYDENPGAERTAEIIIDDWECTQQFFLTQMDPGCYIEVDNPYVVVGSGSGAGGYSVSSTRDWTVSDDASWLNAWRSGNTIQYTYSENTSYSSRKATIYIDAGVCGKILTVTQSEKGCTIEVSNTEFEVDYQEHTVSFTVNAEEEWNAHCSWNWAHVSRSGNNVTVDIDENWWAEPRNQNVHISTDNCFKNVLLTQGPAPCLVRVDYWQWEVEFGAEQETENIVVTANCDWTAEENEDWLSLVYDPLWIELTCEDNPSVFPREGTIKVVGDGCEITLKVTQEGAPCYLAPYRGEYVWGPEPLDTRLQVVSNAPWSVSDNADWIHTWENGEFFHYSLERNSGTATRSARIFIDATGGCSREITITQTGEPCYINPAVYSTAYMRYWAYTLDIPVESNADWIASENADWISVTKNQDKLEVSSMANPSILPREATIYLSGGGCDEDFILQQEGGPCAIKLSHEERILDCLSGITNISVDANVDWNVTEYASWLSIQKDDNSFSIYYDENVSTESRSSVLYVSGGGCSASLEIIQNGAKCHLSPDTKVISFGAEAGRQVLYVNSNVEWSESCNADWVNINRSHDQLEINYYENSSIQSRSTLISLYSEKCSNTIIVEQSGANCSLEITPQQGSIGAEGGNISLMVNSNTDWTFNENSSWITATKSGNTLNVNCTGNTSTQRRSYSISIQAGECSKNFLVEQSGADCSLEITPEQSSIGAEGGNITIIVNSNTDWTFNENSPWITATKSGNTLNLNCTGNTSTQRRSYSISIQAGECSKNFLVEQSGADCSLEITPEQSSIGAEGGNISIIVNSNTDWTFSENSPWVSATKSGNSLNVNCTENTSTHWRSYNIIIQAGECSKSFLIEQSGANCSLSAEPNIHHVDNHSGEVQFTINSNDSWTAKSDVDWLTINNEGKILKARYTDNTELSSRSASIDITSGECSYSVTIEQNGEKEYLIVSPNSIMLSPEKDSWEVIEVESNSDWTVSSDMNWININPTSGSSDLSVRITANSENTSNQIRSARLKITSHGGQLSEILVEQDYFTSIERGYLEELLIHPNPANLYLYVDFGHKLEEIEITISDIKGARVFYKTFKSTHKIKLDLSEMKYGTYLLEIKHMQEVSHHRFIKL